MRSLQEGTGSETQEGRRNAGREALDSIWLGDFGAHVAPGRCLLEAMSKVVGNMLKHWIAAVLFASLMSSVQGLEGKVMYSRHRTARSSGCHRLAVAAIQWQSPGTALGTILWSSFHPPWAPVNPTEAGTQLLPVVCSRHPCSCHARQAAHPSGEGQRLIPGSLSAAFPAPSSLPKGDVPHVEIWAALGTLREQKVMFERTHPGNKERKSVLYLGVILD